MSDLSQYGIEVDPLKSGDQKVRCPRCSHDRKNKDDKSLSVNSDKGAWHCHHCGWKGYADPEQREEWGKAMDWFASRGISADTVSKAGVAVERGWIKFPYTIFWKPVNHKYRKLGEKEFRQDKGGEKTLFGLDFIPADCKQLVWVEGEMDVLACREAGIPHVVSVPDGAPAPGSTPGSKIQFLDDPRYEKFIRAIPTHVIAVDEDAPGQQLRDDLVRRIGYENCRIVAWSNPDTGESAKDANECLIKYGELSLREKISAAKFIPVTGVFCVKDLTTDMYRDYQHGVERGLSTGIYELDELWTVRPRELNVIHGYPGSGKSCLMSRVAVNMARIHGWKFAVFPAENLPLHRYANELCEYHLEAPLHNRAGDIIPQDKYLKAVGFISDHFTFIMPEEDASIDSILSRATVQVRRWGANAVVIDPWTEVYATPKGNERMHDFIERALRKVRKFAQVENVAFFIVAHPAKPKDGNFNRAPHPSEISGSMNWFNKPDAIVCAHRANREGTNVDLIVQKIRFKEVGQPGTARMQYDKWKGLYTPADFGRDEQRTGRTWGRKTGTA